VKKFFFWGSRQWRLKKERGVVTKGEFWGSEKGKGDLEQRRPPHNIPRNELNPGKKRNHKKAKGVCREDASLKRNLLANLNILRVVHPQVRARRKTKSNIDERCNTPGPNIDKYVSSKRISKGDAQLASKERGTDWKLIVGQTGGSIV